LAVQPLGLTSPSEMRAGGSAREVEQNRMRAFPA
jgi:hypothetical protein